MSEQDPHRELVVAVMDWQAARREYREDGMRSNVLWGKAKEAEARVVKLAEEQAKIYAAEDDFSQHAADVVRSWPKWKQELLGGQAKDPGAS